MSAEVKVPGYEVLDVIGRGGHAVVYRARQVAFDRMVALKVLAGVDVDGTVQRRFERECKAAGALSWHLHIVAVHDAGTTEAGAPYLAMEFFEDGSLSDRVRRSGPLDAASVTSIGVQLCGALETAHRAGTLHRDVKPENVLVGPYGEAKLTDFGIATLKAGATVTAAGTISATVAHAAPEVLSGAKATEASDIYSLGSTMFALLAGKPAFVEPTDEALAAAIARIMTAPVPDLGDRGVPEDLCRVVGWAMEKEPGDRPRSAAELGGALQELERGAGRPVTDMRLREPRAAEEVASDETITVPTPPEPLPVARRAEGAREATKATRRPSRWIVLPVLVTVAGAVALVLRDGDGGSDTTTPPEESTITTVPLAALSGTVAISGSSTVEPITTRNVDTFTRLAPNVVIAVDAPNTANGFQLFCDGETDINDASRRINAGEVADCDGGGIDFVELKIAEDAQGRPQFIYVNAAKANESAALEAFVDFYLTDDGLASVTEAGLVALDPREVEASRRIWDQRRTGFATLTP